jgi:hypothetical protein
VVLPVQTAIVHRAPENEIHDRGDAPIGRWTKVFAFTIGLTAAIGGYVLVKPFVAARRSASPPEAVATSAPSTATPLLGAASPDSVQVVKKAKAHKATQAKRRHALKHQTASKR